MAKILIVEDEEPISNLIRMNLTNKHDKVIMESKILSGVNYTITSNLDSHRQAQQRLSGSHLFITGLMG